MSSQNLGPQVSRYFLDKIFCVEIICRQFTLAIKNTKINLVYLLDSMPGFWSGPYMKVQTTLAFILDTVFFIKVTTNSTVTMSLYFFYRTHFSSIIIW